MIHPPSLCTLTYASRPAAHVTLDDVVELVLYSSNRNREESISGVLWYHERLFVQTIEGTPAAIDDLWARLLRDTRHSAVTLIERKPIETRVHDRWGMQLIRLEHPAETVEEAATRLVGLDVRVDDDTASTEQVATSDPGVMGWLRSFLP